MKLAMVSRPLAETDLRLARQMGMTDVVTTVPGVTMAPERTQGSALRYEDLLALRQRVEAAGMRLSVIEGYQLSDRITLGLPGRDDDLVRVCESISNMGRAGIPIYCYNFMAVFNWLRTANDIEGRGGALVTRFDADALVGIPDTYAGTTTDAQMWENFGYFLRRVLPVAEAAGVKLALHPDDPPMSPVRGLARIMRDVDAFKRVIDMADSPHNGITFCQGNFAAMPGVVIPDAIRYFGRRNKIFFAHFRDIRGSVPVFEETFHDEGKTDMVAAMQAYHDVGFEGPMRPDHAPTMEGESNENPGYMVRGQIFAVGYMQGLLATIRARAAAGAPTTKS
ncbi:MAG: mannonate dehydratase [Rhodoferax sp.]|nr:mannonate dehydratase [Rhodoferax sp.]